MSAGEPVQIDLSKLSYRQLEELQRHVRTRIEQLEDEGAEL